MSCQTCATNGRRGYCAPLRCYCGHKTCHAFASWSSLKTPTLTLVGERKKNTKRWDERGDNSWIDKL